jgi:hypothetical protein
MLFWCEDIFFVKRMHTQMSVKVRVCVITNPCHMYVSRGKHMKLIFVSDDTFFVKRMHT